jgi:purine-cytosine permease-like protein
MHHIRIFGRRIPVPSHPILRLFLGVLLCLGGFLGFLPVLGFWMLPVGLLILSIDFPMVRRFRRRATVKLGIYTISRWPSLAGRFGIRPLRGSR